MWSTSCLSLSLHLPDAFLSCAHLILSFLWISAFTRIVLTMRCLLKVRPTSERKFPLPYSGIFYEKISYYFPPAHTNLCFSPFFLTPFWSLSRVPELYMGWKGASCCTYAYSALYTFVDRWHQMYSRYLISHKCMHRGEKKHRMKPWRMGFWDKNHRKVGDLFSLWASVHVTVHVCLWLLAVVCQTGLEGLREWK